MDPRAMVGRDHKTLLHIKCIIKGFPHNKSVEAK